MEFTDPRTLRDKVLTIQQGRKRLQILIKMEQELDEAGTAMTPRSSKELTCLNTLFESHGKKHLEGILNVPRLISGAPYYSIRFSEPIAVLPPPPQQKITPYPKTEIDSWDAIHQACNQAEIRPEIQKIQTIIYKMDIETAAAELKHVGTLLAITIACSYGQQVSKPILKLSFDYHSLAHNSQSTCHSFVRSCISALGFHKLALLSVYKKKYNILKKKMLQTGQLADQMIKECQKLISSCQKMEKQMSLAQQQAICEMIQKEKQEKELKQKYDQHKLKMQQIKKQLEIKQQKRALQKTQFENQLSNYQSRCQDIQGKLRTSFNTQQLTTNFPSFNQESGKNIISPLAGVALGATVGSLAGPVGTFVGGLLGGLFSSFSNGNSQKLQAERVEAERTKMQIQAQEKRQANARAHEIKLKLMQQAKVLFQQKCRLQADYYKKQQQNLKEKIKKNNDLITSVHILSSTVKDNDQLQIAIVCLDIGKNILIKIQTTFVKVKEFWEAINAGCKKSKAQAIKGAENQITQLEQLQLLNIIRQSGLNWLTLAEMNRSGTFMFKEIVKGIDDNMLSLPTQANALKKIEELNNSLPQALQSDNKNLQLQLRVLDKQKAITTPSKNSHD